MTEFILYYIIQPLLVGAYMPVMAFSAVMGTCDPGDPAWGVLAVSLMALVIAFLVLMSAPALWWLIVLIIMPKLNTTYLILYLIMLAVMVDFNLGGSMLFKAMGLRIAIEADIKGEPKPLAYYLNIENGKAGIGYLIFIYAAISIPLIIFGAAYQVFTY